MRPFELIPLMEIFVDPCIIFDTWLPCGWSYVTHSVACYLFCCFLLTQFFMFKGLIFGFIFLICLSEEELSSFATSDEGVVTLIGVVCMCSMILRGIFSKTLTSILERKSAAVMTKLVTFWSYFATHNCMHSTVTGEYLFQSRNAMWIDILSCKWEEIFDPSVTGAVQSFSIGSSALGYRPKFEHIQHSWSSHLSWIQDVLLAEAVLLRVRMRPWVFFWISQRFSRVLTFC